MIYKVILKRLYLETNNMTLFNLWRYSREASYKINDTVDWINKTKAKNDKEPTDFDMFREFEGIHPKRLYMKRAEKKVAAFYQLAPGY